MSIVEQRQYDRLRDSADGSAPKLNMEKSEEILELTAEIENKSKVRGESYVCLAWLDADSELFAIWHWAGG